jgi:protein-tyrosine phosphatase
MKSILFVCTGNIFRSLTAEYALKAALGPQPAYRVSSAGTEAVPQEISPYVQERLRHHNLDPSGHRQRRVTAEILQEADLVVAMGLDHRAFLKEQFGQEACLFNQICFGIETPVLDVHEALPNEYHNPVAQQAYIREVVDYLCNSMPYFIRNTDRILDIGVGSLIHPTGKNTF